MLIYKITNIINNKIYVGLTTNDLKTRFSGHCSKNSGSVLLKNAIQKYGKENFIIEQIDSAESIEELNLKEIFWIKELKSYLPYGYNIKLGGEAGGKLSIKRIGKKKNPCSEETKKKISETLKKTNQENPPKKGKESKSYGKKQSKETIEKRSQSLKGIKKTKEHVDKIQHTQKQKRLENSNYGRPDEETMKKVTQKRLDTMEKLKLCPEYQEQKKKKKDLKKELNPNLGKWSNNTPNAGKHSEEAKLQVKKKKDEFKLNNPDIWQQNNEIRNKKQTLTKRANKIKKELEENIISLEEYNLKNSEIEFYRNNLDLFEII